MFRVSIELQKHEWKFGRTINVVITQVAGKFFHSFFEFFQTSTSVSITRQKHREYVFYFFQKTPRREREKQLVIFDYQNVKSLCSRHHQVNSSCQFCVFNQSARVYFLGLFYKQLYFQRIVFFFIVNLVLRSINIQLKHKTQVCIRPLLSIAELRDQPVCDDTDVFAWTCCKQKLWH